MHLNHIRRESSTISGILEKDNKVDETLQIVPFILFPIIGHKIFF